jgi:hypothetical protein
MMERGITCEDNQARSIPCAQIPAFNSDQEVRDGSVIDVAIQNASLGLASIVLCIGKRKDASQGEIMIFCDLARFN